MASDTNRPVNNELRSFIAAPGIRMWAARMKGAAFGWVQWVGHLAGHRRARLAGVVHLRYGVKQHPGVRVTWIAEKGLLVSQLNQTP